VDAEAVVAKNARTRAPRWRSLTPRRWLNRC